MVKIDRIEHAIDLPEGVTATIEDAVLTIKSRFVLRREK